jgi:acetyltransferase-like isoleucine patch superfamily enzyme
MGRIPGGSRFPFPHKKRSTMPHEFQNTGSPTKLRSINGESYHQRDVVAEQKLAEAIALLEQSRALAVNVAAKEHLVHALALEDVYQDAIRALREFGKCLYISEDKTHSGNYIKIAENWTKCRNVRHLTEALELISEQGEREEQQRVDRPKKGNGKIRASRFRSHYPVAIGEMMTSF